MTTINLTIACAALLTAIWLVARTLIGHAAARAQHQRELAMHERAQLEPMRHLAVAVETITEAISALTQAAGALEAAAPRLAPSRLGHRVTVHTRQPDDQTIFGVVAGDYTDRIVLEDAEYVLSTGGSALPGRQDIEKAHIAWIDVHAHVTVPDQAPETA